MTVRQAELSTARGDAVMVTLFAHPGEAATVLLSVRDADESLVPTVEFTIDEVTELREVLRKMAEVAVGGDRWTTTH